MFTTSPGPHAMGLHEARLARAAAHDHAWACLLPWPRPQGLMAGASSDVKQALKDARQQT
jgi:hypothetical protein